MTEVIMGLGVLILVGVWIRALRSCDPADLHDAMAAGLTRGATTRHRAATTAAVERAGAHLKESHSTPLGRTAPTGDRADANGPEAEFTDRAQSDLTVRDAA